MSRLRNLDCPSSTVEERGQGATTSSRENPSVRIEVGISSILHGSRTFVFRGVSVEDCVSFTSPAINYYWASRDVNDFPSVFVNRAML